MRKRGFDIYNNTGNTFLKHMLENISKRRNAPGESATEPRKTQPTPPSTPIKKPTWSADADRQRPGIAKKNLKRLTGDRTPTTTTPLTSRTSKSPTRITTPGGAHRVYPSTSPTSAASKKSNRYSKDSGLGVDGDDGWSDIESDGAKSASPKKKSAQRKHHLLQLRPRLGQRPELRNEHKKSHFGWATSNWIYVRCRYVKRAVSYS